MKANRALTLLFSANAISGIAQGISMIAIPWYFTNIINKAPLFGIAYATINIISLFWGVYAGTLVDKYNRKNIFIANSIVGALVLISVSAMGYYMGNIPDLLVIIVFAITFFIFNIHYPNLYAFGQEVTPPEYYEKITSYLEILGQSTNMLAGAAAAVLLTGLDNPTFNLIGMTFTIPISFEAWSLEKIFLLDGSTYIITIFLLMGIQYTPLPRTKTVENVWKRTQEGFIFLKKNPLLFLFGSASIATFVCIIVNAFFLLPIYIKDFMKANSGLYAVQEMLFALGAIIAASTVNRFFKKMSNLGAIITLSIISCSIFFLFTINKNVAVLCIIMLLLGYSNAGIRIKRVTYLFNRISNHIIGRAMSVFFIVHMIFRLIFTYLFAMPYFLTEGNITTTYLIMGSFIGISTLVLIVNYKKLKTA